MGSCRPVASFLGYLRAWMRPSLDFLIGIEPRSDLGDAAKRFSGCRSRSGARAREGRIGAQDC